jgi:glycosyltransferase involved in cell wall biosynthesis
MDRPELAALLHTADCYLSPHRSEGFGLTILEAMSLGKPSIATMYSGNVDFMTAENSFPLDYTLVELTRRHGPYREGARWAEPSIDHAARLIREVVASPERAAERGARARTDVERDWSAEAAARAVRSRLETLHRSAGAPA